MDSSKELPTVISFCTGMGGLERGLEIGRGSQHQLLACVEREAYACRLLVQKMESGELSPCPIWTDLTTFPSYLFRDSVDIITGGYPCQPFSVANTKAKGSEDERYLFDDIIRHIKAIRPSVLFFENVEGYINRGLQQDLCKLEEAGYKSTWGIFSTAEVSVSASYPQGLHQRKRVFILSHANGYSIRDESERTTGRRIEVQAGREAQSGVDGETQSVADSNGVGLQGVRPNVHQEGRQRQKEGPPGLRCGEEIWNFESSICRVADGVANRVDRIRLLGNGVVGPQAAKAWKVLNERMLNNSVAK